MAHLTSNESAGTYDFETEEIEGSIQPNGSYHGVARLLDKRTGLQVIQPKISALNLYRLFSTSHSMGLPRKMDREVEVFSDAIQVRWPATNVTKGELTARYEVRAPNAVDLTVTFRSQTSYPAFEVFLSNYFVGSLLPHIYLQGNRYGAVIEDPKPMVPMLSDVFRGTVIVFPRDSHSARHCVDGRWERDEWDPGGIQMVPVRYYMYPFAFQADLERKLAAVLISHSSYCYAISTRYHTDNEADRLTPYSAFDLSLFGNNLVPGEERTVRVRLALTALDDDLSQPLALYRAFAEEVEQKQ